MRFVAEGKETIDALANLMEEFGLAEARLRSGNVTVSFRQVALQIAENGEAGAVAYAPTPIAPEPEPVRGTPVTSPMNGIFYSSPSPSSPPFVREGDSVTAGQVVGLIEAMKVFNEITAGVSGVLLKQVAESGQVVQPGDTLLLIG
jgi:acetyl-CoA carboxylase biotin carboxyl carrier protein